MDEMSDTGILDEEAVVKEAANEVDNAADLTGVENSADIGESTSVNAQVSLNQSPEINFSEDTLMEWPVNGHVLIDYSMDQSVYFPTLDQYK